MIDCIQTQSYCVKQFTSRYFDIEFHQKGKESESRGSEKDMEELEVLRDMTYLI
jgi:hypothetical protein